MSEEYRIALAYSNIQRKYSVAPFISGIIAHEEDFLELERRDLPQKQLLMHRKDSLSWLQDTLNDVSQYLTYHLVVPLKHGWTVKDLEDQYIKILNILRYIHLRVIVGRIKSISIRAFGSYDALSKKWLTQPFDAGFLNQLNGFSANYKIMEKGFDRLLDIARILSRLEYERKRFLGKEYVISKIQKDPAAYLQIIKVKWDSPQISEYNNGTVGLPAVVIRKPVPPSIQHIYLAKGSSLILTPLAKFCRGSRDGQLTIACQYSNDTNPFGLPLIGSSDEQCDKCRRLSEYSICLYRKPLCNGYEARCGNVEFAGNICCGLYGLYVIRLGNDLKVGTAILSNLLGRLLEQGAGYALVIYPLEGIMVAHALEKVVKEHIASNLQNLSNFGVENVYRKAPPKEEIMNGFLQYWERSDERLLEMVWSEISGIQMQIEGLNIHLSQAEHKICKLLDNYAKPVRLGLNFSLKSKPFFRPISGSIIGYRGGFFFLDSQEVVDLGQLQGFVIRGKM